MNYQQTFDQITPCDFQLLTLCGGKSSNSLTRNTRNIHSGTTFAYAVTPELTLKTGVIEQNSRADDTSRAWSFTTHGSKGVLLPVEAELKTHVNGLPGAYNREYSLLMPNSLHFTPQLVRKLKHTIGHGLHGLDLTSRLPATG